jgi:phosphate transport system substrate-binding protein
MKIRFLLPALLLPFVPLASAEESPVVPLRIHFVEPLKKLAAAIGPKLTEQGIKVKISGVGGASEAFAALGLDLSDIAVTPRPMTGEERAAFPEKPFTEFEMGKQALVLIVPEILWQNGIQTLSREQAAGIYEGKITNWNQLGGPNRSVKFFNPAPGKGVWESFVAWLYGDPMKAAAGHFDTVDSDENASLTVQFNSGALSVVHLRWANRKDVYPLAIKDDSGGIVEPSLENIASGKYPLCRSIFITLAGKPLGDRRRVIEWLNGPEGRELLEKNDIIPASAFSRKAGSGK